MDMMPHEDFDVLEQRVREMVQRHDLPPEVKRIEVKFGDLPDGDPALWMELYLDEDRPSDQVDGRLWADVMTTLSQAARQVAPGRSPSVLILLNQPLPH